MPRPRAALGWLLGLTGVVFVLAWQYVQATRTGYSLERLREAVEVQKGRNAVLKLELERWHSPERLESEAARRLGLRRPEAGQVVLLGRPRPPEPRPEPEWRALLARWGSSPATP